ncbi:glycosyltransferase family 4 protein [Akkermansiaceae bacterium]|nr:glycosyltransferase family 4 protein [Akkermansiaceae bacterium]
MSAYSCEPGKGSEPEVGWRVATEMAKHADVHVITRANNNVAIDPYYSDLPKEARPNFLYYDLPVFFLWLKKILIGPMGYYVLWQIGVRIKFGRLAAEMDLLHHVTFNGVQLPGLWFGIKTPVILGPLGGGMTCPEAFLPLFSGGSRVKEILRGYFLKALPFLPWWRASISSADLVLAANPDTGEFLEGFVEDPVPLLLETAISEEEIVMDRPLFKSGPSDEMRLLWLGNLIPRKAPILAVRALEKCLAQGSKIRLVMAGGGAEEQRLKNYVREHGLGEHVDFLGRVEKAKVAALFEQADAFLFTSVRDTSGNVVLEAMSRAIPVITLWHQGMKVVCEPSSAVTIKVGTLEETISGLAEGMIELAADPGLRGRLGKAGAERLREVFTWKAMGEKMLIYYRQVIFRR